MTMAHAPRYGETIAHRTLHSMVLTSILSGMLCMKSAAASSTSSLCTSGTQTQIYEGIAGWEPATVEVTQCGSFGTILGGYGVLGKDAKLTKTLNIDVAHTEVHISATFIRIDSWNYNQDWIYLKADGLTLWKQTFDHTRGPSDCGIADKDEAAPVTVTMPHTGKVLSLEWSGNLNEEINAESWGVKDIQVSVCGPAPTSTTTSTVTTSTVTTSAVTNTSTTVI